VSWHHPSAQRRTRPEAPAAAPLSRREKPKSGTDHDSFSDAVRFSQKGKRMRFFGRLRLVAHALPDVPRGDGAVGGYVIRMRLGHLPEQRPPDLHRVGELLGLYAPGAVVAGAANSRG